MFCDIPPFLVGFFCSGLSFWVLIVLSLGICIMAFCNFPPLEYFENIRNFFLLLATTLYERSRMS